MHNNTPDSEHTGTTPAETTPPPRTREPGAPAPAHTAGAIAPRDRSVIILLLVSAFVVILNETILSVALPPIMDDLDLTETTAQWLTTGFMLTMAVIIPITGYLMGRMSTRQVFTLAMTTFTVGTLICALSPTFLPLLLGRIVQASGTAIMMPLLMTTVMNLVPPAKHGLVMGNISIVISVAPALGPTISGLVLSVAPWRALFLLVLPIAVFALIFGLRRIENVSDGNAQSADPVSVVLSGLGFGTLVYGLTGISGGQGGSGAADAASGSAPTAAIVCLLIGVVSLTLFVRRQLTLQKADRPLLDLRTFALRNFTVAVALMVVMMGAMFGVVVLLPIFLQRVLELSTLSVGLMMLPGGLAMGLLAPLVGRLFDKVGPRPLLVPGLSAVVVGIGIMSRVPDQAWLIVLGHVVMSLGLAFVFTPLMTTALGSLPRRLYPHGSAIVGTVQQVAGAAGAALLVSIMARVSGLTMAGGGTEAQGISDGTSVAFTISAALAVLTVVIALFIRRNPADAGDAPVPSAETTETIGTTETTGTTGTTEDVDAAS
ncbi:MDR family MFS transporter [Brachybacterium fresconis]|uniref:DHA2 family lincomycin resistance protein-like MFS transporter n=1 Tax=Brachybacterium fresconis TaxID=173363 RepID=A0ABS4YMT8_9MICO|nr:DHA2 family lincomycin resistance protein-like MFS transporter [Brachybacterium fresconis]